MKILRQVPGIFLSLRHRIDYRALRIRTPRCDGRAAKRWGRCAQTWGPTCKTSSTVRHLSYKIFTVIFLALFVHETLTGTKMDRGMQMQHKTHPQDMTKESYICLQYTAL